MVAAGGGLLTGKYRAGVPDDARIQPGNVWGDRHFSPAATQAITELSQFADEKGCTLSQLALAWCIAKPGITSAILGARTLEHLQDQLGALNVHLSEADHQRIDQICAPGKTLVSYYYEDTSADFRASQFRW